MTDTSATEPRIITAPSSKARVTIRPFANARLRKASRNVFLKYASLDASKMTGKSKEQLAEMDTAQLTTFKEIPAEVISDIKEVTLKYMVMKLEVTGREPLTDNQEILDYCLDELPDDDFDFIVAECDKVAGNTSLDDQKKTTSPANTPTN